MAQIQRHARADKYGRQSDFLVVKDPTLPITRNAPDDPTKVVPATTKAAFPGAKLDQEFPACSLTVMRLTTC